MDLAVLLGRLENAAGAVHPGTNTRRVEATEGVVGSIDEFLDRVGLRLVFRSVDNLDSNTLSAELSGKPLQRMPLNEDESVNTRTVIGRTAEHPIEIAAPVYVSHMSFGALSREAKDSRRLSARRSGRRRSSITIEPTMMRMR